MTGPALLDFYEIMAVLDGHPADRYIIEVVHTTTGRGVLWEPFDDADRAARRAGAHAGWWTPEHQVTIAPAHAGQVNDPCVTLPCRGQGERL